MAAGASAPFTAASNPHWDHDEWDVALTDGAVYRIFQDRDSGGWFIEAVFD
jgi:hypothetical protein